MCEMGDDHLHEFAWEGEGRFLRGMRFWGRATEQAGDLGFASMPDDEDPEGYPCGANDADLVNIVRGLVGDRRT